MRLCFVFLHVLLVQGPQVRLARETSARLILFIRDTQCAGMSSNCWAWHMAYRRHAHNTHPQNTVDQEKSLTHTHKTKWLLAIMCLEDQRPKQAYCDSDRFQVSRLECYSEGSPGIAYQTHSEHLPSL